MEKIKVKIDWDNNYGAVSDMVPGCVATDKSFEGVKKAYASAIEFHLEGMREDGDDIPTYLQGGYELEFEETAQALLHRLDGLLTRAAISRVTGIDQKQLGHYLSGYRTPRPQKRKAIVDGIRKIGQELISVV